MAAQKDKVEKVKKDILDNYDYVRFTMPDLHGISRGKLLPARNAISCLESGTGTLAGITAIGPRCEDEYMPKRVEEANFPNANMMPDLNTLHPIPWSGGGKYRVGELLTEAQWMDGTFQDAGVRYVARKQVKRLEDMGLAFMSAFEMEFMLLEKETRKPVFYGNDYFSNVVMKSFENFFFDLESMMFATGTDIELMHVEHGSGQFEAVMKPSWGIDSADHAFMFKNGLKEIALDKGWNANFMAKPFPDQAGSGTHLNFSIWNKEKDKNIFYDANGKEGLSEFGYHWIAGLVKHMDSLALFTAPTVNCYRRFHHPWAPDIADWNFRDRDVSLRVKNFSPKATYMENRIPSGLVNPYLAVAATVAAGLDGVNNKLECPPPKDKNAKRLPDNLQEALEALENDKIICEALGEEFVEWFIGVKRNVELVKLRDSDVKVNDPKALDKEFDEYALLM